MTTTLNPPPSGGRPRPVLWAMSILAALQVLAGAAAFTDAVGAPIAGVVVVLVAAIQAGIAFYVQSTVTPVDDPRDAAGNRLIAERRR
jgi:hypothetical protein